MITIRLAKTVVVAVIASFFTVVTFGNIADFGTNHAFVQHVLSMDTTFRSPDLMWRAITDSTLHRQTYWLIIGWEGLTAIFCWLGAISLAKAWFGTPSDFDRAKSLATIGRLFGFLLYGFGFLVVASEWFAMWQSETWNAQDKAAMFTTVILAVLIFVTIPEPRMPGDDGSDHEQPAAEPSNIETKV